MHPLDLIRGWVAMNLHGSVNDNLAPWGKDRMRLLGWGRLNWLGWINRALIHYSVEGWDCLAWRELEARLSTSKDKATTYREWERARSRMSQLLYSRLSFSCPRIKLGSYEDR